MAGIDWDLSSANNIKKYQTFEIWQKNSTMIVVEIWIFKLWGFDQGIHEHAIQKKVSVFWKNLYGEKEKKSNISVSRTTL